MRKANFSYDYQNLLVTLLIWKMTGGSSHGGFLPDALRHFTASY